MLTIRVLTHKETPTGEVGQDYVVEESSPDIVLAPEHGALYCVITNKGNSAQVGMQIPAHLVEDLIKSLSPPCRHCGMTGVLSLPGMES